MGRRLLCSLNDVKPERRLHNLADFTNLQSERNITKALDHFVSRKNTKIATALTGAWFIAVLLNHQLKLFPAAKFDQHLLRKLLGFGTRSLHRVRFVF